MQVNNLLIGSDPEAMIVHSESGKMISAVGLIPGTKEEPVSIGNGCFIQADNVNVEWCLPPSNNPKDFIKNLKYCVEHTNKILPQGHRVLFKSSHEFDDDQLLTKEALEFGCDQDFCAYNEDIHTPNPKPTSANPNLRSCGGHIHFGSVNLINPVDATFFLKRYVEPLLGVALVALDPDQRRKELYGKAGAFRLKPYGIEYRTPSNFWLTTPELIEFVFDLIYTRMIDVRAEDAPYRVLFKDMGPEFATSSYIQSVINENQVDAATKIMDVLGVKLPVLTTK